jgi:hypothetical protein
LIHPSFLIIPCSDTIHAIFAMVGTPRPVPDMMLLPDWVIRHRGKLNTGFLKKLQHFPRREVNFYKAYDVIA